MVLATEYARLDQSEHPSPFSSTHPRKESMHLAGPIPILPWDFIQQPEEKKFCFLYVPDVSICLQSSWCPCPILYGGHGDIQSAQKQELR